MIPASCKYVVDANVLIQAHRGHYAFDIAPSFWKMIAKNFNDQQIISVDKVYEELKKGKDVLFNWINDEVSKTCFLSTDTEGILETYAEVAEWAMNNGQFTVAAKAEFSQYEYADPWLICLAKNHDLTIITQEVFDANVRRKIPIPNVCKQFGIKYIDTVAFLREIKFSM
ncbi:DUF4411 family protein [Niabella sp. 22666]|uniref:DUF4411 family protein n=1 Tax=Niabella sp. 22666 TaxID=3453954 RepID=UPI003F8632DA